MGWAATQAERQAAERETRTGPTIALWATWLSVGWADFWQGCQLYDPCRALRIHRQ
jgi:hypothetical protein